MKQDYGRSNFGTKLVKMLGFLACFSFLFSFACKSPQEQNPQQNQQDSKIKVEVLPVQNGKISCKTKDGNVFTDLEDVPSGTKLTFTLTAKKGFKPLKLVIDGTDYKTLNADGNISQEITIVKSIEVSGDCFSEENPSTPTDLALTMISFTHQNIESIIMDSEDIKKQTNNAFILPAVPLKVDSLDIDIEVEPSNANLTYNPPLENRKWKLKEGENILKLTIKASEATKEYTFKIARIDIELKSISMVREEYPSGGNPKKITFEKGDWKDNQHFEFVTDNEGSTYLTFALKEGVYEHTDSDETRLFNYTATLKTNPPQEISGNFYFIVRDHESTKWDKPPLSIAKKDYNDADPIYDYSFSPHITLDEKGFGMIIPTHIFAVDFETIKSEAELESISFVVENVTGKLEDDMAEGNPSIVKFGGNSEYELSDCKDIKIENTTQKILVLVLPKYAMIKVTSIEFEGEGIQAPSGEGKTGYYRYIDFNNTNKGKNNLIIRYQSQDASNQQNKSIEIERSDLPSNTNITSIKVCDVNAVLEDDAYTVTLKKANILKGKVEVTLEDTNSIHEVYTFEKNENTQELEKVNDITNINDVDFSLKENQSLGIFVTPQLGKLYKKFYNLTIKVEE